MIERAFREIFLWENEKSRDWYTVVVERSVVGNYWISFSASLLSTLLLSQPPHNGYQNSVPYFTPLLQVQYISASVYHDAFLTALWSHLYSIMYLYNTVYGTMMKRVSFLEMATMQTAVV